MIRVGPAQAGGAIVREPADVAGAVRCVVTNPDAKALLALVTTPSQIGLPLLGPPGISRPTASKFCDSPICG